MQLTAPNEDCRYATYQLINALNVNMSHPVLTQQKKELNTRKNHIYIYLYITEIKPDLSIGYSHEMTCTQSEAVRRGFFFAFSE
jgi:hypothetical protein